MKPKQLTHEGRLVRDLFQDEPDTIIVREGDKQTCPFHPGLIKQIAGMQTALCFLADWIGEIKADVRSLKTSNGVQNVSLAVLKTRAAVYGAIAAVIVSPFAVGAALLLFRKVLNLY